LLSCDRLFKKPLLFKSFTGLSVQEFDDIYNKEITKRCDKHAIQCLSSIKRKVDTERKFGAGRSPFNLDLRDRFVILLIYYRLYITYTLLTGFLFDLDQSSNICSNYIQKIEKLIRDCLPIPQKIYTILQKEAENS